MTNAGNPNICAGFSVGEPPPDDRDDNASRYNPGDEANGGAQHSHDEPSPDQFPKIDEAAYHGLAGDIVRTIEPHTEAHPVAILIQTLTSFGSVIGSNPHYVVEADKHRGNLFAVLVGATAKGRKGTAAGRVRSVFKGVDDEWMEHRIRNGLSSGEGLIEAVHDADPANDKPGVMDKRLLIVEPEFANALAMMERAGNTLSPVLRAAWDGHTLSTMTKHSPTKATDPHISVVGHITEDELRARLNRTEAANGFGNRFLYVHVHRSKLLPHGGDDMNDTVTHALSERLRAVLSFAQSTGRVSMTPTARKKWETVYPDLSAEQPGLLGAVVSRAEAQTIRLSLLYALLDERDHIDTAHLRAALAVWEYAEASAVRIFGDSLGDPVADEIFRSLQRAGSTGMTRTAIRDLFSRNKTGDRIDIALRLLVAKGRARMGQRQTPRQARRDVVRDTRKRRMTNGQASRHHRRPPSEQGSSKD